MTHFKIIKAITIGSIIRFPLILLIALLPGFFAVAQVKFTTVANSQEIGRGDYLQIEFVIENAKQIDQLNPPDFPGFQVVQGPIQSSGMSIVNGNMSQYKALSFVLQPAKAGKFTIQGATANVDGKQMRSNAVTITVSASASSSGGPGGSGGAGSGSSAGGGPGGFGGMFPPSMFPAEPDPRNPMDVERDYILKPGENIKDKIHKNLFVKVQIDKTNCYVGEPIVATYKLYTRLRSNSRVTKRPSLNGFSVYDMVDPSTDVTSVEKVNGKSFVVHTIRKTQLIPLQAGTIDLDPLEVENVVQFVKGRNRPEQRKSANSLRDLFEQLSDDDMMGPEITENVTLDTKPVTITVKPLPEENKPAGFNGAVGAFSVQATLTKNDVAAQDVGTLKVVVTGKGNLPVVNAPAIQWPAGIDGYDPSTKEDIDKSKVPMSGSKTFEYTFMPSTAGHYVVPAVSLSYFDPASGTYKQTSTTPIDLQVTPGTGKAATPSATSAGSAARGTGTADGQPSRSMREFMGKYQEWVFAVLILSGIGFFLWRHNRSLKKEEQKLAREKGMDNGIKQDQSPASAGGNSHTSDNSPYNLTGPAGTTGGAGTEQAGMPIAVDTGVRRWSNEPMMPQSAFQPNPDADINPPVQTTLSETELRRKREMESSLQTAAGAAGFNPPADPLQDARKLLSEDDYQGFYRELNRAVWRVVTTKLDLPASEMNKSTVVRRLEAWGWDATAILSLENILNECEMNLYTPVHDARNMQQLLGQAESLIANLA